MAFKKSLQVELNQYFDSLSVVPVTKVALVKARKKLKVAFFEDFFSLLVERFYQAAPVKRFKGLRLWACDGSAVKLPDNADTRSFGTHTNQYGAVASVKLLCYFDLLNHLLARLWLKNKRIQEIRLVQPHVKDLPKDVLSIYDRHYGSHLMVFLHQQYGSPCLIRMKAACDYKHIKAFLCSGKQQATITEPLQERAWREVRKMGLNKSKYHQITYRLIRVELSTGETEVLLTTLLSPFFTVDDFAWLYGKRWGVETCFDQLKNLFKAPVFSGYSALVCKQDLWAVAILFNLQTLVMLAAEPQLKKRCSKRKTPYQINRNVSLDSLKRKLQSLFLSGLKVLKDTLDFLLERFLKSLERVLQVEPRPRIKKKSRLNARHQTEYNYKAAI
jgi:hypothetical protein